MKIPFELIAPKFEENPTQLVPEEECLHLAREKALSVQDDCPNALVLGCDTLVALEGEKLGKPADREDAQRILKQLSGKRHAVHSAAVLLDTETGGIRQIVDTAWVTFKILSDADVEDYVRSGEPMDKAGAYGIQGRAGEWVTKLEGDMETVIGLPTRIIQEWLRSA